jgi:hypothetical protein
VVLRYLDGFCVRVRVAAAERFDGCCYGELVAAVRALEEFKGICRHCCSGKELACVCDERESRGMGPYCCGNATGG